MCRRPVDCTGTPGCSLQTCSSTRCMVELEHSRRIAFFLHGRRGLAAEEYTRLVCKKCLHTFMPLACDGDASTMLCFDCSKQLPTINDSMEGYD
jgi:hypothetical protein